MKRTSVEVAQSEFEQSLVSYVHSDEEGLTDDREPMATQIARLKVADIIRTMLIWDIAAIMSGCVSTLAVEGMCEVVPIGGNRAFGIKHGHPAVEMIRQMSVCEHGQEMLDGMFELLSFAGQQAALRPILYNPTRNTAKTAGRRTR